MFIAISIMKSSIPLFIVKMITDVKTNKRVLGHKRVIQSKQDFIRIE